MIHIQQNEEKNYIQNGCGVGLGNFDGLHIGHMALISTLVSECKKRNVPSLVYTFLTHPYNVLNKSKRKKTSAKPLIITTEKKVQLLDKSGVDLLYLDRFDQDYAKMSPNAFVKNILVEKFNIKLAVVGFNYTFGYKGEGNAELLRALGEKYKFDVVVIPPIKIDNDIVSSTLLRKHIERGALEKVRLFTGRDYSIYGIVEVGRQIGTKLGYPTANIIPEDYLILPRKGVYITRTQLDGKIYNSITNIGKNPTFGGQKHTTVETHIFGREGNMYGKRIEVFFLEMLREEKIFLDSESLREQIRADIMAAKEFFKCRYQNMD